LSLCTSSAPHRSITISIALLLVVRRSLIPWSLRFVLAATVSDARGSRVLLRHGLGGTKPARRHRTTAGIFIRLGWALKEPTDYFASRGTAVARGIVPSRSRLAPTRDMSLGSRARPDHGFEVGGALLLESRAAEECLADLRARGAPRKRTPRRRAEALAG